MLPAASCASLRGQPRSKAAWKSASAERSERRGLLNAGRGGVGHGPSKFPCKKNTHAPAARGISSGCALWCATHTDDLRV